MKHLPDHLKGLIITTAGVLVLTPDSLLVRLAGLDPWTMVFWRGSLMALALGTFLALCYRRRALARLIETGLPGFAVATIFAIGTILFVLALNHTSVAHTLIIIAAAPLIAAVLSRLVLAEAVSARTWAAIGAAVAGIALLATDDAGTSTVVGDLAALGTAVCMASGLVIIRRARRLSMVPAMALSGLISAVIVSPFATPGAPSAEQMGLLLILGLVVLPVAFGLTALGPRYLTAPEVSLILLLETVLGPLWVWLVLDEEPSRRALIGGAVVIAALVMHSLLGLRRRAAAAPPASSPPSAPALAAAVRSDKSR